MPKPAPISTTTYRDYYPFGMEMPGRSYEAGGYRFGFNGKESDPEAVAAGSQYDYGFRIYNTGLARFLSVDPLTADYPMLTPFQYASNNPIMNIDIDGLEGAAATMPAGRKWSSSGLPTGTTSAVSTATVYIPKPKLLPTLAPVNIPQSNGTLHRGLSNYERFLNTAVPPMGDPIGTAIRTDPVLSSVSVGGALLMATTASVPLVTATTSAATNAGAALAQGAIWLSSTVPGAAIQTIGGATYSVVSGQLAGNPIPDLPNTGGALPYYDAAALLTDLALNTIQAVQNSQQSTPTTAPPVNGTGNSGSQSTSNSTAAPLSQSSSSDSADTIPRRKTDPQNPKSNQTTNKSVNATPSQPIGINTVKFTCQ